MEGKTKTFSRLAGILNLVTAVLLVVAIVMFWGVLSSGAFSGESTSSAETTEEAVGQAAAIFVSLIFFLPIILILLVPLGLIDVISGLAIGLHCLKKAPGRGTVIYSLILKILTVPTFGFAIILIVALGDVLSSTVPALFPTVFGGYLVLLIAAHVFEWMANVSSRKEVASSHVKYEEV
ncbi:MAG: hypothetical protein J6X72_03220 [Clostridia bacterium]|nr:hypothetical protein [Clostridia bacterium]